MRVESRSWSAFRGGQASGWARFACLLPLAFGVLAKLRHPDSLFSEYRTVACAGQHAAAGEPFYSRALTCGGEHVPSFVYLPEIARIAGGIIGMIGEPGFRLIYLAMTIASVGALIAVPLFARAVPGAWKDRLPFAAVVAGGAVLVGNVAVILHGAILAAAILFELTPWILVAAIVFAAWVKPIFLAALAVILVSDIAWPRKIAMTVVGVITGLLPTLLFAAGGGELAQQWFDLLSHFVFDVTPGKGLLGWLQWIGINGRSPAAHIIWFIYASALLAVGLVMPRVLKLSPAERVWLGLAIATLVIPRIMAEDVFLIGPGLLAVGKAARRLVPSATAVEAPALTHGSGILHALCLVALTGGLTGAGDVCVPLAILGFSLYLLFVGQIAIRQIFRAALPQLSMAADLSEVAE